MSDLKLTSEEERAVGRMVDAEPRDAPTIFGITMRKGGWRSDCNPYEHPGERES